MPRKSANLKTSLSGLNTNAQGSTSNTERPIPSKRHVPVVLTIAGSDSSAGAGIQADLKTFSALGVYGLTVVTCVVAETPGTVVRIEPVSASTVRDQLRVLLDSFPVAAIKTGLLYSAEIISTVVEVLATRKRSSIPLIVDPVMVATSGEQLLRDEAVDLYEKELFPRATLITPNLDEARTLLGRRIEHRDAMIEAGRVLADRYETAVLLKGGHLSGDSALDLLFNGESIREFHAAFLRGVSTHGTGCTYSAAIASGLAAGLALEPAIEQAKKFVTESIRNYFEWNSIHALNHFRR
jgi:hydroxymethylpyrimidine/phosphomethylpyrimidine kinase